jgi:hypothetical protein
LLGAPGATFFCGKPGINTKKEKSSKKERNGDLVETDAADGNPLTTRIPTAAWKAQNAFHSSHKVRRRFSHRIHFLERQRSTLNTLSFGPKDGEHLIPFGVDVGSTRRRSVARSHPYRITKEEGKEAFRILNSRGPLVKRLKRLLEIRTGKRNHQIGKGFRNDIQRILNAS